MTEAEVTLLECFLRRSSSYFEFGVGGSTCLAARTMQGPIFAVDSNPEWIERVRANLNEEERSRVSMEFVDIGPVGDWGMPVPNSNSEGKFDAYSASIVRHGLKFDFVLVDGRFRVASALQAIEALQHGACIGIHDYVARPQYHVVERFLRPIASVDQLVMFCARPNISAADLHTQIQAYRRVRD